MVLVIILSVLFPALLVVSVSPYQGDIPINPFELGVWALPFLVVNSVLLILCVLHFTKRLPQIVEKTIRKILDFELSKPTALIIMLILISYHVGSTVQELQEVEFWGDFPGVKNAAENWSFQDGKGIANFRYFLLNLSINIFDNIRVMPFFFSIALLILTYFITVKISQKRFSGILAVIVILQSSLFLEYDTTATYDNVWIVLYLVSLYTIYKKWYLSPFAFIFSVFSKALTAAFLPMSLFFIYRSGIPKRDVIKALIPYGIIIALFIAVFYLGDLPIDSPLRYYGGGFADLAFWRGFTAFSYQLRYDGLVLTLVLPLVVGLYLVSRRGIMQADSILIMILGMLLIVPLLTSLTSITPEPYRYIPLLVFFAIGIGTLFSKRLINRSQDLP
ncbi:MAG: hypothetical protein IH841_06965 [Thaumarchaeota archaeon]|nr:hypothetical protein [Nitrososphaerota archaeon]